VETVASKSTREVAVPKYAANRFIAAANHVVAGSNKKAMFEKRKQPSGMRTLQTRRLRLVPVNAENAEVLWDVLQEPGLRDFQDLPDLNVAQFRRAVAARPKILQAEAVGRFEWLIYFAQSEHRSRKPLGWVSLRVAERTPATAEVGYSVRRAFRDRGIATEAVAALVAEAFDRARVQQLRAYCVPENAASRAVLRSNGFQDEGVVRHGATVGGQAVDVISHVIDRERWAARTTGIMSSQPAIRS
jgi:RimJ/RimL family protein N-acetyltransferase